MVVEKTVWQVVVCMGSSCFVNGNATLLDEVKRYLEAKSLTASVELKGTLCQGECTNGPIMSVNGQLYAGLNRTILTEILDRYFSSVAEDV